MKTAIRLRRVSALLLTVFLCIGLIPWWLGTRASAIAYSPIQVAQKVLKDADGSTLPLTAGQFQFTLTPLAPAQDGGNGYYTLGDPADAITTTNDAGGAISIDWAEFSKPGFYGKYCYDGQQLNNVYNGAYAFRMEETDAHAVGYTYDSHTYVISVVFLNGTVFEVTAMSYAVDAATGHYLFDTANGALFSSNPAAIMLHPNAQAGYVQFSNTYSDTVKLTFEVDDPAHGDLLTELPGVLVDNSVETRAAGDTINYLPAPKAADGYEFVGWVCSEDPSLTIYPHSNLDPLRNWVLTRNTTVTAIFRLMQDQYTITYKLPADTGYAGDSYTTTPVDGGTKVPVINADTAEEFSNSAWTVPAGMNFVCWWDDMGTPDDTSDDMPYLPEATITLDTNKTLVAAYAPVTEQYTVTYEQPSGIAGGSFTTDPLDKDTQYAVIGTDMVSGLAQMNQGAAWAVPENSEFDYWTDTADNQHYLPDAIITMTANKTLVAHYKSTIDPMIQVAQKILVDAAGKSLALTDGQFSFTMQPLAPTQNGENGYYTLGDTSDAITATNGTDGKISINSSVFTQKFHDKYCDDGQNLNQIYNGAYAFLMSEVDGKDADYQYDTTHSYLISIIFIGGKLCDVAAMKYTVDESGHYRFDSTVDALYSSNGLLVGESAQRGFVPFTNTYSAVPTTVTFKVVNGTWSDGTTADKAVTVNLYHGKGTLLPASVPTGMKANSGYTGGAWDAAPVTTADGVTKAVTYTYSFTRSSGGGGGTTATYTLTFATNGGSAVSPITRTSGTVVPLTQTTAKSDDTFAGWYSDAALTAKVSSVTLNKDMTVYAKWTKNSEGTIDWNKTDHFAYIIGYTDGLVHPEANITRGETVTIFFRLMTDTSRNTYWKTANTFSDVTSASWYNNAASTMENANFVKGYSDGTFGGSKPITRAEFAAIAARANGADGKYDGDDAFSDISGHWARATSTTRRTWGSLRATRTGRSSRTRTSRGRKR
jgi:uncharacterized repeat protein (TIGR02543 family)